MRAVYSAVLATVALLSCMLNRAPTAPAERTIQIDTTALIIRIYNYQPQPVRVLLIDLADSSRHRVGDVVPMHEAFFILPSREVVGVVLFRVLVIPSDTTIRPYRTGEIVRNTAKVTMVFVAVGDYPKDSSRAPGWRS